jgi:hypothetical protein
MVSTGSVGTLPGMLLLEAGCSAPTSSQFYERRLAHAAQRAWTIPADEARTLLHQLQQKIASSEIEVGHRDVLIRFRSIIEEDLEAGGGLHHTPIPSASDHKRVRYQ